MDKKITIIQPETLEGISNAINTAYNDGRTTKYSTDKMQEEISTNIPAFITEKVTSEVTAQIRHDVAADLMATTVIDGLVYTLNNEGTDYTCTGFYDKASVITANVADIIGTSGVFKVTSIADRALKSTYVTSVYIPGTINIIPGETSSGGTTRICQGSTTLTDVTLQEGLTTIGYMMFDGCSSLEAIKLPDTLTYIDGYAFKGTSLKSITIPDNVTSIGRSSLTSSALTEVYLGLGIKKYTSDIFASNGGISCDNLTDIYVPYEKDEVNIDAWKNSVPTNARIHYVGEQELDYVLNEDKTYYICTGIGNVTDTDIVIDSEYNGLPVKVVGSAAFLEETFTTVYIPESIERLEYGAFANCENITDVYYEGSSLEWSRIYIDDYNTAITNANIHYAQDYPVTATVSYDYDIPLIDAVNNVVDPSYVDVRFTKQSSDGLTKTTLTITIDSNYPYETLVITNGYDGEDLDYIEVPLRTMNDGTIEYSYSTGYQSSDPEFEELWQLEMGDVARFILNLP